MSPAAPQREKFRGLIDFLPSGTGHIFQDVEETIELQPATFMHKGMHCGIAAFNEHGKFGFWKF
jgi:hypothetical protein